MAPGAPDDAAAWRERARRLAEEAVRPHAEEIDRTDRLPAALVRALAAEGLLGLGLPEELGGCGGDSRALVAVLEELAAVSSAVAVELAVHLSVCAHPIARWGSDAQRRLYVPPLARGERIGAFALTEPGAGSDAAGLRTRYAAAAGGFEISGAKMFISNAATAGTIVVFATRDPALGHRGISAFALRPPTPGLSVAQRLDKLGLRGSETTELVLDRVRAGPEALLGAEGDGLKIALSALAGGRVGIASCALGVARAAFDRLRADVRADDAPWKRHRLARAFADLSAARALVARAAERKDAGEEFVADASVAKFVASRAAVQIASDALEIAGPAGARSGAEAERLFRDARVFPLVEGTTEIQELILARELLGSKEERTV